MSTIELSGAAGASAAPEAVGARLTASPNPGYERRWMALGVLVIAQIMILLDATIVRALLVPALMSLCSPAWVPPNWAH